MVIFLIFLYLLINDILSASLTVPFLEHSGSDNPRGTKVELLVDLLDSHRPYIPVLGIMVFPLH